MSGTIQNIVIAVDSNRDLYLDSTNNLAILSGLDGLQQSCLARIEAQLHEMLFDFNDGMPTMDTVFRQQRLAQFVAAGRRRLLTVEGVLQIKSFQVSISNGQLYYVASILTQYSNTLLSVSSQGV